MAYKQLGASLEIGFKRAIWDRLVLGRRRGGKCEPKGNI